MATEAPAEANLTQAVPFFLVADVKKTLHFYVDGLGFRPGPQWAPDGEVRWCWLSRGGVALMVQQGHPSWKPAGKVGEGVTICIMCEDAIALYHEFRGRGIAASRPFVGNSLWVTSVTDPDGFRLDFESPTDAPEESRYQEG